MYLPLVFAVDLIQHFKAQNVFADRYLVAVAEEVLAYLFAVNKRAVPRLAVGKHVLFAAVRSFGERDLCMNTRDLCIVHADVRFESPAESDLFTFEWDGDCDQLSAQENQSRAQVAKLSFRSNHRIIIRRRGKSPPKIA